MKVSVSGVNSEFSKLIDLSARQFPDKTALQLLEQSISYQELSEKVINQTEHFKSRIGVPRKIIALEGESSLSLIVSFLSIIESGHIAAPLNMRYPELSRISQAGALGAIRMNSSGEILSDTTKAEHRENILQFDAALIIHTSGSSGTPKAALLSEKNLIASAQGVNTALSFTSADRWLCPLPLWHVGGLGILVRTLQAGGTMLLADSANLNEMISKYQPTHLSLVDLQLSRILESKQTLTELKATAKAILLGGSAISKKNIQRSITHDLPIYLSYGLTEMSSTVTIHRVASSDLDHSPVSSGKTLDGRQIRLSTDGIIQVNGATRFLGYLKNGELESPFDPDGWFSTGDRGELSIEGELSVQGRADNMFISGGENIQPEQIEAAIAARAGVTECIVVPASDNQYGYRPVAFVKFMDETNFSEKTETLALAMRVSLPGYMIPVRWFPFPEKAVDQPELKWNRSELTRLANQIVHHSH
jgi:O-succinylbenzoic acid--CoA ligase